MRRFALCSIPWIVAAAVFASEPAPPAGTPAAEITVTPAPPPELPATEIPVDRGEGWSQIAFRDIRPNEVRFTENGLVIEVKSSSSPLLYPLPPGTQVRILEWTGHVSSLPKPAASEAEEVARDDYPLRVGLIVEGDDGPGWVERMFAPRWLLGAIKQIGERPFSRVEFLTLSQRLPVGDRRKHPSTRYISQEVVGQLTVAGHFQIRHDLRARLPVSALWVHADGDASEGRFVVTLKSLRIR
jgi:hypothetical protein